MEYRSFGNTCMQVSRLSLGAMTFCKRLDRAEAARVVDEALDHGINLIDTADSYPASEKVLGQIVSKEKRKRVYLATKVYCQHAGEDVGRNSRVNILQAVERSLALLRTDYIDLYQLHHPDEETLVQETLSTLDALVKQGKIRHYGVSNHYAWQMSYMLGESKAMGLESLVSYQACYNMLDRQIEAVAVHFCNKFNIPIMCYSPLCRGLLIGEYPRGPGGTPPRRASKPGKWPYCYLDDPEAARILARLSDLAREHDLRLNELAILWLLAQPHASTVILGGSRPEHFTQVYDVLERKLPPEVLDQVGEMSRDRVWRRHVNQPHRTGPGPSPLP